MRIARHVERSWVWYLSAALFLWEEIFLPLPHAIIPFFRTAIRDASLPLASLLFLSALRSFLTLSLVALTAECLVRLATRLKRPVRWGMLRVSLTLSLYGLFLAVGSGRTVAAWAVVLLVGGSVGVVVAALFPKETSPWTLPRRQLWSPLAAMALILLFCRLSAFPVWKHDGVNTPTADMLSAPSFVLFGLDSVPSAFFNRAAFARGLDFQNAYAASNSTYTSWFSLLSGRYPHATGVDLLFPSKRIGKASPEQLLPSRLREKGYRTVFMTDCASLSFFEKNAGFGERYQPDQTMFGCMRSALESRHPLNAIVDQTLGTGQLSSECSLFSDAGALFNASEKKVEELAQTKVPYLLAVHSCATAPESVFRKSSPAQYLARIDSALQRVKTLQEKIDTSSNNTWSFYFSDHGVVWNPRAKSQLSHATGDPVALTQYNVPLLVVAPKRMPLKGTEEHLVSLLDIYPTVEKLAGLAPRANDGYPLSDSPQWDRALALTSAFPVARNSAEFRRALLNVHLTEEGVAHFSEEEEEQLRSKANVGLISSPHRLLLTPSGRSIFFEENSFQRIRVSAQRKQELVSRLCAQFSHPSCAALTAPSSSFH